MKYEVFTDIVFNPPKSKNCQARFVAMYILLKKSGLLEEELKSKERFLKVVYDINDAENLGLKQMSILDL